MKRLFLSVLTAVLMVSGTAYAQDSGYMVKGKVVSVNTSGRIIRVYTDQGEKTIIIQEGAQGFSDVKPGDNVEMSCVEEDGKTCAKSVTVIAVNPPDAGVKSTTSVFEGEIVSLDPTTRTMVLKNNLGQQVTLSVQSVYVEKLAPAPGGTLKSEPIPATELKPGTTVRVDCFDSAGKFCANRITVIQPGEAAGKVYTGQIVSIDPEGKSIVISTNEGQKTLYYQESTTGVPLTREEIGKRVQAYCLDVEGKSCIRDITEAPAQ